MAFRFRRSIRIAPGLRVNLGKRGVSLSAGARGASVTWNKQGLWGNVGLPGTGLSYRERFEHKAPGSGPAGEVPSRGRLPDVAHRIHQVHIQSEDGSIRVLDEHGDDLGEAGLEAAKTYAADSLRQALDAHVAKHNQRLRAYETVHEDTPAPTAQPTCSSTPFNTPEPVRPALLELGVFARLFRSKREAVERKNHEILASYRKQHQSWQLAVQAHEQAEAERAALYRRAEKGDWRAMESVFEDRLDDIDWPLEGDIAIEAKDATSEFDIELELPAIETLPAEDVAAYKRGIGLSVKPFSTRKRNQLFARYAHAMAFRLIGEAFAVNPSIETVALSAFTSEINPATGHEENRYFLDVRVGRSAWEGLNFSNLASVDPVDALARFNMARSMTKTGILKPLSATDLLE